MGEKGKNGYRKPPVWSLMLVLALLLALAVGLVLSGRAAAGLLSLGAYWIVVRAYETLWPRTPLHRGTRPEEIRDEG